METSCFCHASEIEPLVCTGGSCLALHDRRESAILGLESLDFGKPGLDFGARALAGTSGKGSSSTIRSISL